MFVEQEIREWYILYLTHMYHSLFFMTFYDLGIEEAHVFVHRKELPRINPIRYLEKSGLIDCFLTLIRCR